MLDRLNNSRFPGVTVPLVMLEGPYAGEQRDFRPEVARSLLDRKLAREASPAEKPSEEPQPEFGLTPPDTRRLRIVNGPGAGTLQTFPLAVALRLIEQKRAVDPDAPEKPAEPAAPAQVHSPRKGR